MNTFELNNIIATAKQDARVAASEFEDTHFPNGGWGACGFAWVNLYSYKGKKLDGRSRIAKELQRFGIRKAYGGGFQLWNPSEYPTQNVDTLEAGARAAAEVFRAAGFEAYAGSRLD